MAKSKLKSALDRHKGRDYKLEKQRKQEKAAAKRKAKKVEEEAGEESDPDVLDTAVDAGDGPDWETEEDEDEAELQVCKPTIHQTCPL